MWFIASPISNPPYCDAMFFVHDSKNYFSTDIPVFATDKGIRPVVVIPKSNFRYELIEEN